MELIMTYRTVLLSSLALLGTGVAFAAEGGLSLCDIESKLTAQGIKIREVDLKDSVAEVEGRDAQGRKVELLIDRRSGEILSQKLDD
jgi:hypothetical protein